MPRLYDEILEITNNHSSTQLKSLRIQLPLAQVFMASNVHELIDPNAVYHTARDFPNAAPPFDSVWVEWSVSQEFADAIDFPEVQRCGTLTTANRTDDGFSLCIYGVIEMMDKGEPAASFKLL